MKSSPFQIILIAAFGFFIIVGMITLYFTKGKERSESQPVNVTLWGTIPSAYVTAMIDGAKAKEQNLKVSYKQISEANFDETLIEALASYRGPDAVIVSEDGIIRLQDKLYAIPFSTLSEDAVRQTYVTAAESLLSPWGTLAVPFGINPIVMYWNRDIFANAGLATPPRYWDEFPRLTELLNKKDGEGKLIQSAVALGEFSNINNAKAVISALVLESGTSFISRRAPNGDLMNSLDTKAFTDVMDFFTEFSNPSKEMYSWSRSWPNSQIAFAQGDVAVYFDFASEVNNIKARNPNLDFEVAYFPTGRDSKKNVIYGEVYGVAVLRASSNPSATMNLALLFGGSEGADIWSKATGLPPVRRDLLGKRGNRPYDRVFYDSALWSRGLLDPDPRQTTPLFREMVERITSGWMTTNQSVSQFSSQLSNLISGR